MWEAPDPRSVPAVAAFGKTPRMGDFLRTGSAGPATDSFDDWIQQGMAYAEAKRGAGWPAAYASGAPWAYTFRPPRSASVRQGLVGVLKPSVDSVGRRFPLVIAAPLGECVAPWPHLLPMAFGDFLDAAATLLLASEPVTGVAEMQAALHRLPPAAPRDAEAAARDYDAWAASTPLSQAWGVIYGGGYALSAPRAIHTLLEALAPFRGEEAPNTKLSLRLPLGSGGVAAAAFWIDAVRHMARSLAEVRTCFWSAGGDAGSILVQLGNTPSSSLGELWSPDPDSEYACDLTVPASVDVGRFLTRLPPHLVEVLQAPAAVVRDFLGRLMF